jgi:uncharacterized protein YecT (DUF1311 family)
MTISRFELVSLAGLFLLPTAVLAAAPSEKPAGPGSCGNINPFAVRKCVSTRIERKERLMRNQLVTARIAVTQRFRRYGRNDTRTDPKYLDASQAAWKRFVENNCTVIAAYNGGSNSAISDREMYCYEGELDRRIRFLRDVAQGTALMEP